MFFFVVMALENFSWLIDPDQYIVPGLLKFSDIGVLSALLWMVYVYAECRKRRVKHRASLYPAAFIMIILISSVPCFFYFGQSFGLTIRQNRYIIISFMMYYFIMRALRFGKLRFSDLMAMIKFQALLEIVIFLLQYLLVDKIHFVHTVFDSRYGSARLRVSYLLPLIFAFIALSDFLNGKKKVRNLIYAALGIMILAVVCKHRAPTMLVLATLVCAYFLWKKDYSTKLVVFIIALILLVAVVSNSVMIQDTIRVLLAGQNAGEDNFTIRQLGQAYYFERLTSMHAWLAGFGEPNISNLKAYNASGVKYRYFLADNGVFGFLYCHGIIGIAWLAGFYTSIFKKSYYLLKKDRKYQYILYILFEIGNLYMGMHWYYYYSFPFILIFTALNWEYSNASKGLNNRDVSEYT